nr:hypothetical protein HK105_005616 [Polyrhizophydium stewartii]
MALQQLLAASDPVKEDAGALCPLSRGVVTRASQYSFPARTIRSLLADPAALGTQVTVNGWVRSLRRQKSAAFVDLDDGSALAGLQVVMDGDSPLAPSIKTGTALRISGTLVHVSGKKQAVEVAATDIVILGDCDSGTYPLHKARLPLDHLRENQHLRSRTRTFGAIWRAHEFMLVSTPILTSHDCEGGGEAFRVLTDETLKSHVDCAVASAMRDAAPQDGDKNAMPLAVPQEFFGKPVYATVSGQLHAEFLASALSRVYTLGPTFRAEKSQSTRHLAEFWMLEAEACFLTDVSQLLDLAEAKIKHVVGHLLDAVPADLAFFDEFVERGLIAKLERVRDEPFARVTYTEAVSLLQQTAARGAKDAPSWEFPVKWGLPLQSEHEKHLAQEIFGKPVFVTDYPKEFKPFYMKASAAAAAGATSAPGETVACTDLLVPKIGELVGGSLREDRLDVLRRRVTECGLSEEEYQWYLDLRRYGSVPHGGYGMGFERFLGFVTGVTNLRDLIPAPRYFENCRY